jgi:hypothetical protein
MCDPPGPEPLELSRNRPEAVAPDPDIVRLPWGVVDFTIGAADLKVSPGGSLIFESKYFPEGTHSEDEPDNEPVSACPLRPGF